MKAKAKRTREGSLPAPEACPKAHPKAQPKAKGKAKAQAKAKQAPKAKARLSRARAVNELADFQLTAEEQEAASLCKNRIRKCLDEGS